MGPCLDPCLDLLMRQDREPHPSRSSRRQVTGGKKSVRTSFTLAEGAVSPQPSLAGTGLAPELKRAVHRWLTGIAEEHPELAGTLAVAVALKTGDHALSRLDGAWLEWKIWDVLGLAEDPAPHPESAADISVTWKPGAPQQQKRLTDAGQGQHIVFVTGDDAQERIGETFDEQAKAGVSGSSAAATILAEAAKITDELNAVQIPAQSRLLKLIGSLDSVKDAPPESQQVIVEEINRHLMRLGVHLVCPTCGKPSVLVYRNPRPENYERGGLAAQHVDAGRKMHVPTSWASVFASTASSQLLFVERYPRIPNP